MSPETIMEKNSTSTDLTIKEKHQKYTLIVTEKIDAAKRIAYALDYKGKPQHLKKNCVPYFIAQRKRKLVIVPSIGHLYTISQQKEKGNGYPIFNFKWVPRHLISPKSKSIHSWIKTFSQLSLNADTFISACDYDIEGSLIGYNILKYACVNKDVQAKRMKFSTLQKSELEKAYLNLLPHLDFPVIEAGRIRHEVDWLYGINFSRALSFAFKSLSGRYCILSTGRVQGPTLQFLTKREKIIRSFVPIPYWEISAEVQINDFVIAVDYEKNRIETKDEAKNIVQACKNKIGEITKVYVRTFSQKPLVPFDLGTLQREAYNLFGYTPKKTLLIAQRLYLRVLISYPRTSSQKLPPIINYRKILSSLKKKYLYNKLATTLLENQQLKPREGVKDDPAHPAIYPTGNLPEKPLDISESRIWDLIVRRFMAVFGEPALKENTKVQLDVNGHKFFLRGNRIRKKGWMEYYAPYIRFKVVNFPSVEEGDRFYLRWIKYEENFTCPPCRYNPSSLLNKMEKLGIGTKTTRADIIQTLYNRGYVRDERIVVTELGFIIIDILETFAPAVTSIKLTQELEDKMDQVKNNLINRENVITDVIEKLRQLLLNFKENEKTIGRVSSKATKKGQVKKQIVGKCPNCNTGDLIIISSRKTGKRFIGCTNYFKRICSTSFPLPQKGAVKPAKSKCKACGWPQVLVWIGHRKPWKLCFNPNCSFKKKMKRKN